MAFRPAKRSNSHIKMALVGIPGSGKSWSALLIAQGLADGGKIAVIDTEDGSADLYEEIGKFDVDQITAPHSITKYINMINAAYKAGYSVLIIDGISKAWSGVGGILDQHQMLSSQTKNSFTAWAAMTPIHDKFIQAILQTPMHIICTMRADTGYEIKEGKPLKIGLKPDQRKDVEFEFTLALDIARGGHVATASKDRTGLFKDESFVPTIETGIIIKKWLAGAVPEVVVEESKPTPNKQYVLKQAVDTKPESMYDEVKETQEDVPLTLDENLDTVNNLVKGMSNQHSVPNLEHWRTTVKAVTSRLPEKYKEMLLEAYKKRVSEIDAIEAIPGPFERDE